MARNVTPSTPLGHAQIESPIGVLDLWCRGNTIYALGFAPQSTRERDAMHRRYPEDPRETVSPKAPLPQRIRAYFEGNLGALETCGCELSGTPFQLAVWQALRDIPTGETRTYAEIARAVDRPRAVRAVATAIGRNGIGIAIPCHRVIASDGGLAGFAWGIERKAWLLRHETRTVASNARNGRPT